MTNSQDLPKRSEVPPPPETASETPRIDITALFADGRVISQAVAAGVAAALRRHRAAGVPAYVWRDGAIIELPSEELPDSMTPSTVPKPA